MYWRVYYTEVYAPRYTQNKIYKEMSAREKKVLQPN